MAYTTIDDPSEYFHTQLYTGNGSTQSITNNANAGNFKPDWLWIKIRSSADGHHLFDSSRGVTKRIHTDSGNAEVTISDGSNITSFDSDGFSLGSNGGVNGSSSTYVGWQWKCNGGTTSSNSDGSITSTVQVNTTAGFSIVLWTGDASNTSTVGHGLGVAPKIIIIKNRSDNADWALCGSFSPLGINKRAPLNGTGAVGSPSDILEALPTTALFQPGDSNDSNGSSDNMVAYCFAEVKGYSKFGSYTGNGAQDGTFVYTGFKPAFVLAKRTDTTGKNWYIADSTRSPNNITKAFLSPNLTDAEDTSGDATDAYFDILSNGFKMRQDFSHLNASGGTHIYMAFAEHPFVSSKGVPVTAR